MSDATALRQEIVRFVQLTGRRATPHAVAEGMRNRWDVVLDPEVPDPANPKKKVRQSKLLGTKTYGEQMNDMLRAMLEEGEIELNQSTFVRRQRPKAEPSGWISFAWTADALVNGHKTVTRREWTDNYAARFHQGDLLRAYDKRPAWGGKAVALIRLTQTPYKQRSDRLPATDWYAEGFAWLQGAKKTVGKETPREVWRRWQDEPQDFWVIKFEVVELL